MKRFILPMLMLPSAALLAGGTAPSAGQPETKPVLTALGILQPGLWTIQSPNAPSENRSLCVTDTQMLLQLRHAAQSCKVFVITNSPREATVHYSCASSGNGRTTLRVENARLVQIESQGIINRAPFLFTAEGRRVGACVGGVGSSGR